MRFHQGLMLISLVATCFLAADAMAQQSKFPPVNPAEIRSLDAEFAKSSPVIDGKLDEACWTKGKQSAPFVDLISGRPTIHETRVAVRWDDNNLYLGYWVEEPFLEASLKNRDDPIYKNNDVEFFLAGEHAYYEFEINSYGTIYEGLFVWQSSYEKHGFDKLPLLDRSDPKVDCEEFNGVGLNDHPRGLRWAFLKWDFPGVEAKVHLDGTINDNSDRDRRWTVELKFPWKGLKSVMQGDGRSVPPNAGDEWRIHFSRFNQYKEATPANDSSGWAFSPHGVWDSHVPECFPVITFRK